MAVCINFAEGNSGKRVPYQSDILRNRSLDACAQKSPGALGRFDTTDYH